MATAFVPDPALLAAYEAAHPRKPQWSIASWRENCRVTHVHNDWTKAKPRELCQPFTFAFTGTNEIGQGKFVKGLEKLRRLEAREAKKRQKQAA